MIKKTKKNFYRILFVGFIVGFLISVVFVFGLSKLFLNKNKKNSISESQMTARYYDPKVFEKPKNLQTLNKISSVLEKKEYRIPIIMYHYVEYVKDPLDTIRKNLDIFPFVLEKELETLNNNHYQTLFVKEVPKILSGETSYSSRSAVLTFDDGYEDFYTDVFPLLKKYQIKATIYVVYDFIGRKGFLNEKEIKEIISSKLVEIGSHTLDHLYLKKLSKSVVTKQVIDSKKLFEDKFNIKIETFAYPYGAFSQDTIDFVKSAGYTAAVSVIPGIKQSNEDLFYLYRIRAGSFSYGNIIKFFENYQNK
ncbi:MAG TPA: polysaccharide deacetylase family protein [Patescibacteria group bacterium]